MVTLIPESIYIQINERALRRVTNLSPEHRNFLSCEDAKDTGITLVGR